jgi:hypothetical protein
MCIFILQPKILIVDDPSLPVRHELKASPALPQEVLLCLPKENWTSWVKPLLYIYTVTQTHALFVKKMAEFQIYSQFVVLTYFVCLFVFRLQKKRKRQLHTSSFPNPGRFSTKFSQERN